MRATLSTRPLLAASFLLTACLGFSSTAFAWTPPVVGTPCRGTRGGGSELAAFAGNYMGGRPAGRGMRDYRSFQSCFRSEMACNGWLARHAQRYPMGPQIASCTRVVLR
jgi:hypothetical protein